MHVIEVSVNREHVKVIKISILSYSSSISATTLDVSSIPVASWEKRTKLPFSRRNSAKISVVEDSERVEWLSGFNNDSPSTFSGGTKFGAVYTISSSFSRRDFELYSIREKRSMRKKIRMLGDPFGRE